MIGDIPAYPQDTGDYTLLLNVGYDYTGYAVLAVRLHAPDETVETVTTASGDVTAYDPTNHLVSVLIKSSRTDQLGRWRVVADIDGKRSEPAGSYDVVVEAING
jgi:hypothetical protein